uniref:Uncharacterized protein n=1 Tax=Nelumbo nucifera TaxID=4432 RepID=A0A822YJ44_NELNU|nr:TPA_asm: hypothetical protein HUJ06_011363 [Nelumbo nucifera]
MNPLSLMIQKRVDHGELHGVQVRRGFPVVSHLLFANDLLFFWCSIG